MGTMKNAIYLCSLFFLVFNVKENSLLLANVTKGYTIANQTFKQMLFGIAYLCAKFNDIAAAVGCGNWTQLAKPFLEFDLDNFGSRAEC